MLTGCASFYVFCHPIFHAWPPVVFLDLSYGFIPPWVAGHRYVVVVPWYCPSDFSDIWYDGSSFQGFCHSGSVWRDDGDVLVVLFSMVFTRWSRQCIGSSIGFTRDVLQDVIIFLEVCVPSGCATVQVSRRFPVLEVGMVSANDEGGFCPSKVVSPVGQVFLDSQ